MNDDYIPIQDSLGFIIYRTALTLKAALQRCFKENGYDFTPEQWGIIRHLGEEDGLSQREIGEKAFKDKPNITRIIDALEKKHLIFRQPDPRDRRKYCIYLTKEGKQLHDHIMPLTRTLRAKATRDLAGPQLELLKQALNQIYHNLNNS
jgi:DNA-binding MarR family transcriptional regulator